jgi:type VI secretion system protein ImpC
VFPFEEFPVRPGHEEYLWGNPAIACLLLLTRAIAETGRPVYPGMNLELGGLPIVPVPGAASVMSCAESLLDERAAERMLDGGLMALMSVRDTDRIRLVRFQSIAQPSQRLAGGWLGG